MTCSKSYANLIVVIMLRFLIRIRYRSATNYLLIGSTPEAGQKYTDNKVVLEQLSVFSNDRIVLRIWDIYEIVIPNYDAN